MCYGFSMEISARWYLDSQAHLMQVELSAFKVSSIVRDALCFYARILDML